MKEYNIELSKNEIEKNIDVDFDDILSKNEIENNIDVDFDDIISITKQNEQLDPIDKIIKLIRSAKTEKEARKLFEEYFDLLMSCDVVQAWIDRDRKEVPNDDYYLSKHDEMFDEASKVLLKAFEDEFRQQTELKNNDKKIVKMK